MVGSLAAGASAAIVVLAGFLEHGRLGAPPLPLVAQALALPVLFGVLSQAIAYRRAVTALGREHAFARAQCCSAQA